MRLLLTLLACVTSGAKTIQLPPRANTADQFGVFPTKPSTLPPRAQAPQAVNGASMVWNLTAAQVGKVSMIDVNGDSGVIGLATTFFPLAQVTIVDLTGAIMSKSSPGSQFTYAVDVSDDASVTAVYGCPASDVGCGLSVFKGTDIGVNPMWSKDFNGSSFWEADDMQMSADGSLVAVSDLDYRPQMPAPVPGSVMWFDGSDGTALGSHRMDATLGGVWVDRTNASVIATREFDLDLGTGSFETLDPSSGAVGTVVPDKYNGIAVSPDLTVMMTPSDTNPAIVQLFDVVTGKMRWEYEGVVGLLYSITLGNTKAVVGYFDADNNKFLFDIFDVMDPSQEPKPLASISITIPDTVPSYEDGNLLVALAHDDAHVAFALNGVGIHHLSLAAPIASESELILDYPDTCGFLALGLDTTDKGNAAMVLATTNVRTSATECAGGAGGVQAVLVLM